jgi:hypothetical protein
MALFARLIVVCILVAVPVFIGVVLWRFLRAYEFRARQGTDVAFLQRRVSELEEEVRELRADQTRARTANLRISQSDE